MSDIRVWSLGWEDPLNEDRAIHSSILGASLVSQRVKCLPAMQEIWVWSLGREDPLEKEMATHSSTLAWKIRWMEKPGRLQSMWSQRVRHDWASSLSLFTFTCRHKECMLTKAWQKWQRTRRLGANLSAATSCHVTGPDAHLLCLCHRIK